MRRRTIFTAVLALVVGLVGGAVVLLTWQGGGKPSAQAAPATQSPGRWCADAEWLRQGAVLVQRTWPQRDPTAENVRRGMEYGGTLRSNYNYFVQQGSLPAGIEDELVAWAEYLAASGPRADYQTVAGRVVDSCR